MRKIKIFTRNLQNYKPEKVYVVHCISTYLSNHFVPEDGLSPTDSQDVPDEGSDQTVKMLYESYDNGNYIDFSNAVSNGELILGSKNGEIFTYLPNREETEKLNSDTVEVFSLSDDPQNIVIIELLCKYIWGKAQNIPVSHSFIVHAAVLCTFNCMYF